MSKELQQKAIEKELKKQYDKQKQIEKEEALQNINNEENDNYDISIICNNCYYENKLGIKKGIKKDIYIKAEVKCFNCKCILKEKTNDNYY